MDVEVANECMNTVPSSSHMTTILNKKYDPIRKGFHKQDSCKDAIQAVVPVVKPREGGVNLFSLCMSYIYKTDTKAGEKNDWVCGGGEKGAAFSRILEEIEDNLKNELKKDVENKRAIVKQINRLDKPEGYGQKKPVDTKLPTNIKKAIRDSGGAPQSFYNDIQILFVPSDITDPASRTGYDDGMEVYPPIGKRITLDNNFFNRLQGFPYGETSVIDLFSAFFSADGRCTITFTLKVSTKQGPFTQTFSTRVNNDNYTKDETYGLPGGHLDAFEFFNKNKGNDMTPPDDKQSGNPKKNTFFNTYSNIIKKNNEENKKIVMRGIAYIVCKEFLGDILIALIAYHYKTCGGDDAGNDHLNNRAAEMLLLLHRINNNDNVNLNDNLNDNVNAPPPRPRAANPSHNNNENIFGGGGFIGGGGPANDYAVFTGDNALTAVCRNIKVNHVSTNHLNKKDKSGDVLLECTAVVYSNNPEYIKEETKNNKQNFIEEIKRSNKDIIETINDVLGKPTVPRNSIQIFTGQSRIPYAYLTENIKKFLKLIKAEIEIINEKVDRLDVDNNDQPFEDFQKINNYYKVKDIMVKNRDQIRFLRGVTNPFSFVPGNVIIIKNELVKYLPIINDKKLDEMEFSQITRARAAAYMNGGGRRKISTKEREERKHKEERREKQIVRATQIAVQRALEKVSEEKKLEMMTKKYNTPIPKADIENIYENPTEELKKLIEHCLEKLKNQSLKPSDTPESILENIYTNNIHLYEKEDIYSYLYFLFDINCKISYNINVLMILIDDIVSEKIQHYTPKQWLGYYNYLIDFGERPKSYIRQLEDRYLQLKTRREGKEKNFTKRNIGKQMKSIIYKQLLPLWVTYNPSITRKNIDIWQASLSTNNENENMYKEALINLAAAEFSQRNTSPHAASPLRPSASPPPDPPEVHSRSPSGAPVAPVAVSAFARSSSASVVAPPISASVVAPPISGYASPFARSGSVFAPPSFASPGRGSNAPVAEQVTAIKAAQVPDPSTLLQANQYALSQSQQSQRSLFNGGRRKTQRKKLRGRRRLTRRA